MRITDEISFIENKEKIASLISYSDSRIPLRIFGLSPSEEAVLLSFQKRKTLVVAKDLSSAIIIKNQLSALSKKVETIFSVVESPILQFSLFDDNEQKFVLSLEKFLTGDAEFLIVLPSVLLQRLPSISAFEKTFFQVEVNQNLSRDNLVSLLVSLGLERAEYVQKRGEFSVRGDIVDVYNPSLDEVVRIDFFGDLIEDIKILDPATFSVREKRPEFVFTPFKICQASKKDDAVIDKIEKSFLSDEKLLSPDAILRRKSLFSFIKTNFDNGNTSFAPLFLLPFFEGYQKGLLSLFENINVVFEEPKLILDDMTLFSKAYASSFSRLFEGGELLAEHKNFFLDPLLSLETSETNEIIVFSNIKTISPVVQTKKELKFSSVTPRKYLLDFRLLKDDLEGFVATRKKVFLFTGSPETKQNISEFLNANGILTSDLEKAGENETGVYVSDKNLPFSACFQSENLFLIGTNDLVKKVDTIRKKNKSRVFYLPKVGDYVVHEIHGIGKCVALERLKLSSLPHDYFIIEYRGGDRLYVPSEQADEISAYLGGEGDPKLNKIGGVEFGKEKARVLASVKEMAGDLIKLYGARKKRSGFVFSPDNYLQTAFEDSFPFEETDDQTYAISEVKKDMESDKMMDRLICGDVGFGKTEVALRAIFKAVQDLKQVAFLCPTTILSEQHFSTAKKRFEGFDIKIEVLNRFKTPAEQTEILKKLQRGDVDVLIGTHRLLRDDVKFADLGLLVIDEEQRFGVADKEKIKSVKEDIDVLSLSATPIPRTLHMSLSGIRDISIIATPPKERLPVQTTVAEYSDSLLEDACKKELARDGQVLVIFNRVEKIESFADHLRALIPSVPIGVAHGQMKERELENAISKLYSGEYRILVATTLIENGVDLPNANTLFVVNSDYLGLSALYQLRGRIGRASRLAYAYFTFNPQKILTQQAYKRLEAITGLTELGSGFRIAMRDLEIRGAGNVLGKEQHGQMEKVGYDLYCKILDDSIKELKGEKTEKQKPIKLDISVPAYISEIFMPNEDMRIKTYADMSGISSNQELEQFIKRITESFSTCPIEIVNLGKIALCKNIALSLDIKRILISKLSFQIEFYSKEKLLDEKISSAASNHSKYCVLKFEPKPIIEVKIGLASEETKLSFLVSLLLEMKK